MPFVCHRVSLFCVCNFQFIVVQFVLHFVCHVETCLKQCSTCVVNLCWNGMRQFISLCWHYWDMFNFVVESARCIVDYYLLEFFRRVRNVFWKWLRQCWNSAKTFEFCETCLTLVETGLKQCFELFDICMWNLFWTSMR